MRHPPVDLVGGRTHGPYLYGAKRSLSWRQASSTAAPYISDEAEAAVGEALGTLSVDVSLMKTLESGTLSACAATCGFEDIGGMTRLTPRSGFREHPPTIQYEMGSDDNCCTEAPNPNRMFLVRAADAMLSFKGRTRSYTLAARDSKGTRSLMFFPWLGSPTKSPPVSALPLSL